MSNEREACEHNESYGQKSAAVLRIEAMTLEEIHEQVHRGWSDIGTQVSIAEMLDSYLHGGKCEMAHVQEVFEWLRMSITAVFRNIGDAEEALQLFINRSTEKTAQPVVRR